MLKFGDNVLTLEPNNYITDSEIRFSNLETEDLVEQPPSLKIMSPSGIDKKHIFRDIILSIIFLIVGILIGWFSRGTQHETKSKENNSPSNRNDNIHTSSPSTDRLTEYDPIQRILEGLDKQKIKSNLQEYTKTPHLTGTIGEKELVDKIFETWKQNGLTDVVITPYEILMSYPNISQPNKVEIRYNNQVVFTSRFYEKTLRSEDDSSKLVPPYNSFAPSGIAEGPLIYVNYGRIEDFQYLHKNHSINFTGAVVIARYGKIFRGDKLKIATKYNASGMILYTDPSDFNIDENKQTYPQTWWLPKEGVQRGTVGADGDYLTPLYPATKDAYRISLAEAKKLLPKIPCQPIGYGDAQVLLTGLLGDEAPRDWQGKLPIKYKIGRGHMNSSLSVRLQVNNYEKITTTWNVIGYIKGKLEPDRYVLLGNHHDSWVYSAVDPLSGSAALTEITRVLGNMAHEGWQPRRTIVFCSWGGEEQGLIGSTEWVEEHMKELYERAVAYLNVDYAADFYEKLDVYTSPLLQDVMYKSAKRVPNPSPYLSGTTLYDIWTKQNPGEEPKVSYSLGSGSDMATFYQRAGVPSMDFFYTYDTEKWPTMSYPSYHTAYDTFYSYAKFVDPSFNYTLAISQLWSILACYLAEDKILEFDLRRYSNIIAETVYQLSKDHVHTLSDYSVNIEPLKKASKIFVQATERFHDVYMRSVNTSEPLQVRILNDKMIQLERTFIDPEGINGKRYYKHVIFAPMEHDAYSDTSFPGIKECIWKIDNEGADLGEELKQQVSIATYTIMTAAESLDEIGLGFNKLNLINK